MAGRRTFRILTFIRGKHGMEICVAVVLIVLIRWQLSVSQIKKCSFYIILEERVASSLQETKGESLYELLV